MPSNFEQVNVPDDLKMPGYEHEEQAQEEEPKRDPEFYQSIVALAAIWFGTLVAAVGASWWVHPGAGLVILGLGAVLTGVLVAVDKG